MNRDEKRLDHRIVVTRSLFREALTQLMREKPIESITIKELCEKAGVNRSTFYLHYEDIYSVLYQIEKGMIEEFHAMLGSFDPNAPRKPEEHGMYDSLFSFFYKHADICEIMLSKNSDRHFVEELIAVGKNYCADIYRLKFGDIDDKMDVFYPFVSNGCIGILKYWLKNRNAVSKQDIMVAVRALVTGCERYLTVV